MNLAEELMKAFEGFRSAHGQTEVSTQRMAGKQKAKSYIVRNPLTLELVQRHIDGKQGVGAIPINEDNKCKFGEVSISVSVDIMVLRSDTKNNIPVLSSIR